MHPRTRVVAGAVLGLLAVTLPLAAQQNNDLTYNTVTPCVFVDTRLAVGPIAGGQARTYNVVGSGSFAGQGGSATGCGVPGFSNGVARVQAVAINIVAFAASAPGHFVVGAADVATGPSFLNYQPGVTTANTGPVAVAQTPGVGDIRIAAAAATHIIASVVGYYTRFGETIIVGPRSTPAASGAALLAAVTSIADNSASKPYLIKVEPGVYDVGSTMLVMKPWVDIEGSGQQTTVIQGVGNNDGNLVTGVVKGASNAEIRNLQVKSSGASFPISIGIVSFEADPRVRDVTVVSSGATTNWGLRIVNTGGGRSIVDDVTVEVPGGSTAYGIVVRGNAQAIIEDTRIRVSNSADANGIFIGNGSAPVEIVRVRADVTGSGTSHGIRTVESSGIQFPLKVDDSVLTASGAVASYGIRGEVPLLGTFVRSTIQATGGSTSFGVDSSGGLTGSIDHCEVTGETATVNVGFLAVNIGASRLSGGPAIGADLTCAGVYDETYTFFASTCP